MARTLTDKEKREYDRLTKDAKQIRMNMDDLMNKPASGAKGSSKGQDKGDSPPKAQDKTSKSAGTD
ncbi:MAG: hypothetical protein K6E91_04825 [Butyrivibrio sp.]|nr:hypothetical protein [Butyrivibrio sp.]